MKLSVIDGRQSVIMVMLLEVARYHHIRESKVGRNRKPLTDLANLDDNMMK